MVWFMTHGWHLKKRWWGWGGQAAPSPSSIFTVLMVLKPHFVQFRGGLIQTGPRKYFHGYVQRGWRGLQHSHGTLDWRCEPALWHICFQQLSSLFLLHLFEHGQRTHTRLMLFGWHKVDIWPFHRIINLRFVLAVCFDGLTWSVVVLFALWRFWHWKVTRTM